MPRADEGTAGSMGLPARTAGNMVLGGLTVHARDPARATGQEFVPDESVLSGIGPGPATMAPMAREAKVSG
ncbi:hypothetical protein [Streptomyces sp. NPDC088246]|uniref:hypothetical protein n=1 Tax=Streptomyces sp. NPDC088246 TaxID=3365842 RepID=UPI0038212BCC